jgi:hypothetical protein
VIASTARSPGQLPAFDDSSSFEGTIAENCPSHVSCRNRPGLNRNDESASNFNFGLDCLW